VKEYKVKEIRNLSLVGHGGVGKTSLAEALLFSAGKITRMGKIEEGSTQSDYSQDEIERQISISTSLLHLDWKSHRFNILDTPGYTDFVGEVISALSTVGLSTGITGSLSDNGLVVIMICMFVGRTGPLVVASSLIGERQRLPYSCPEADVMVG